MAIGQTEKIAIKKTPDVCGGDACIGDRRIMVWLLVEYRRLGMSDERIMSDFDPPLTQADLEAAWEYCAQNRDEIDTAIDENQRVMHEEVD